MFHDIKRFMGPKNLKVIQVIWSVEEGQQIRNLRREGGRNTVYPLPNSWLEIVTLLLCLGKPRPQYTYIKFYLHIHNNMISLSMLILDPMLVCSMLNTLLSKILEISTYPSHSYSHIALVPLLTLKQKLEPIIQD